jgi:hypothetical protein
MIPGGAERRGAETVDGNEAVPHRQVQADHPDGEERVRLTTVRLLGSQEGGSLFSLTEAPCPMTCNPGASLPLSGSWIRISLLAPLLEILPRHANGEIRLFGRYECLGMEKYVHKAVPNGR